MGHRNPAEKSGDGRNEARCGLTNLFIYEGVSQLLGGSFRDFFPITKRATKKSYNGHRSPPILNYN